MINSAISLIVLLFSAPPAPPMPAAAAPETATVIRQFEGKFTAARNREERLAAWDWYQHQIQLRIVLQKKDRVEKATGDPTVSMKEMKRLVASLHYSRRLSAIPVELKEIRWTERTSAELLEKHRKILALLPTPPKEVTLDDLKRAAARDKDWSMIILLERIDTSTMSSGELQLKLLELRQKYLASPKPPSK